MKISSAKTLASVERYIDIEGGPIAKMDTSYTGKTFQVQRIRVTYTWKNGAFFVEGLHSVQLFGPVIKQDGTHSKNFHAGRIPSDEYFDNGRKFPLWLRRIAALNRPGTDFSMSQFRDYDIETEA